MTSSVCSDMSTMSVSVFGEEVVLEVAIDNIFNQIQDSINNTHCEVREMCCDLDRENDFKVSYEHYEKINNYSDDLAMLFKELKSVSKQVLGKADTTEDKQWLKEKIERKKRLAQITKDDAKREKETSKCHNGSCVKIG
jgi:methyl coenzyme M reductase subunit D